MAVNMCYKMSLSKITIFGWVDWLTSLRRDRKASLSARWTDSMRIVSCLRTSSATFWSLANIGSQFSISKMATMMAVCFVSTRKAD